MHAPGTPACRYMPCKSHDPISAWSKFGPSKNKSSPNHHRWLDELLKAVVLWLVILCRVLSGISPQSYHMVWWPRTCTVRWELLSSQPKIILHLNFMIWSVILLSVRHLEISNSPLISPLSCSDTVWWRLLSSSLKSFCTHYCNLFLVMQQ